jgi:hypothetical protein
MTPTDVDGVWREPQNLKLSGRSTILTMNSAGDFVVTSDEPKPGQSFVRCSRTADCSPAESNPETRNNYVVTTVGPYGDITMLWARNCRGEACSSKKLVAQRGH